MRCLTCWPFLFDYNSNVIYIFKQDSIVARVTVDYRPSPHSSPKLILFTILGVLKSGTEGEIGNNAEERLSNYGLKLKSFGLLEEFG